MLIRSETIIAFIQRRFAPEGLNPRTALRLSRLHLLEISDGLSQYMTVLGIAKAFDYWAEWHDIWDL